MRKFETLKAGLGNGLIVSLTEQGHAECDFYTEDFDLLKPYKIVNIDFEHDAIYTINSLTGKSCFDDLNGEFINPHLFPLNHLTKPIRVEGYNDGKEFVPIHELIKIDVEWMKDDSDPIYKILGKDLTETNRNYLEACIL